MCRYIKVREEISSYFCPVCKGRTIVKLRQKSYVHDWELVHQTCQVEYKNIMAPINKRKSAIYSYMGGLGHLGEFIISKGLASKVGPFTFGISQVIQDILLEIGDDISEENISRAFSNVYGQE